MKDQDNIDIKDEAVIVGIVSIINLKLMLKI